MQINLMQPGQTVADFAVSGAVVSVAGVPVDCAFAQQDVAVVIEIRSNDGVPGVGGDGAYLAQIAIPARRYETTIAPAEGEDEQDTEVREPQPLDPDAVVVTLWPTA